MFVRKVILLGVLAIGSGMFAVNTVTAEDWTLAPSYYSHNPQTGQRTQQYAQHQPAVIYENPTYMKSGYHHRQSTIRNPWGGLDQLHVIEEWGRPVRPYGEWQRPFRPYSVPYQLWGPPYGGLGGPTFQNNQPGPYPYLSPYQNPYGQQQGGQPWGGGQQPWGGGFQQGGPQQPIY